METEKKREFIVGCESICKKCKYQLEKSTTMGFYCRTVYVTDVGYRLHPVIRQEEEVFYSCDREQPKTDIFRFSNNFLRAISWSLRP